jgi:hypothetical protein
MALIHILTLQRTLAGGYEARYADLCVDAVTIESQD